MHQGVLGRALATPFLLLLNPGVSCGRVGLRPDSPCKLQLSLGRTGQLRQHLLGQLAPVRKVPLPLLLSSLTALLMTAK